MRGIARAFKEAFRMIIHGEHPNMSLADFHEGWAKFPLWEKVFWVALFALVIGFGFWFIKLMWS